MSVAPTEADLATTRALIRARTLAVEALFSQLQLTDQHTALVRDERHRYDQARAIIDALVPLALTVHPPVHSPRGAFGPLTPDSMWGGGACILCGGVLRPGVRPALVADPDDPESDRLAHEACAHPEPSASDSVPSGVPIEAYRRWYRRP